jgi:hypothetical protein
VYQSRVRRPDLHTPAGRCGDSETSSDTVLRERRLFVSLRVTLEEMTVEGLVLREAKGSDAVLRESKG